MGDEISNGAVDLTVCQRNWEKDLKGDDYAAVLVLVRDPENSESFHRIGLLYYFRDSFFKGCPWETIRIV